MAEVKVTYKTKTETKVVETKEPVFNLELDAKDVVALLSIVGSIGGIPENSVRDTASPIYNKLHSLVFGGYNYDTVPSGTTGTQVRKIDGYKFFENPEIKGLVDRLKRKYQG